MALPRRIQIRLKKTRVLQFLLIMGSFVMFWNDIFKLFNNRYIKHDFAALDQTDPKLVDYVRGKYLTPPSTRAYNMTSKLGRGEPTDLIERMIAKFFKNKRGGTFIEAGAYNGDTFTHTYFLERALGWKGLLVECNPQLLPVLMSKNRKAWIASACVSPNNHPGFINFTVPITYGMAGTIRKITNPEKQLGLGKTALFEVPIIPLYTLLAALGPEWNEIDFFGLDIEGTELSAMKHFPFDKIIFKVVVAEMKILTHEEQKELGRIMFANGYEYQKDISTHIDRVFVHKSVLHLLENDSFI